MAPPLHLHLLRDRLAVCRLPANSDVPSWIASGAFRSVSWTPDETSVVCEEAAVPAEIHCEPGWRALGVEGPLDFGLTGVLSSIAQPLADAGVSIFAVSTFDTDYVLVRESSLVAAVRALEGAGHVVESHYLGG